MRLKNRLNMIVLNELQNDSNMKLASYTRKGQPGFGAVVGDGIVDLTNRLVPGVDTLKGALAADLLPAAADFAANRAPDFAWSSECAPARV